MEIINHTHTHTMEYTITIKGKEYKATLRDPLFLDYRMASVAGKAYGVFDHLAAGSSLIQHCWTNGDEALKDGDETKDPELAKAYMSFCATVYTDIFGDTDVEVKKK